jgi:hypothetical protein
MDEKNNRNFISFLMDAADVVAKVKQEARSIKESRRVLTEEEYHTIKDLLLEMVTDAEIAEQDMQEYQRAGFVSQSFVVAEK